MHRCAAASAVSRLQLHPRPPLPLHLPLPLPLSLLLHSAPPPSTPPFAGVPLPVLDTEFFDILHRYFPCIYDIKYLMRTCDDLRGDGTCCGVCGV